MADDETPGKSKPRVSVIMGVYNSAETIRQCIDSILQQTLTDFELIICDDASTDNTLSLLNEYASHDSRIIVLRNQTNHGIAYSLNKCIALAQGEYLARMDGDDESHPSRFAKQMEFLEKNAAFALCGSGIRFFDETGIWGHSMLPEEPTRFSFLNRSPFAHPTIMIRAATISQVGNYSDSADVLLAEDLDLFMRLYAAGHKGYNIQEYLLDYREDTTALKRRTFSRALAESRMRWRGYKLLGLFPIGAIFALKPVLVAMFPSLIYRKLRHLMFSLA